MACRNLTKKFVDIRNAGKANRSLAMTGGDDSDPGGDTGLLKVLGGCFILMRLRRIRDIYIT